MRVLAFLPCVAFAVTTSGMKEVDQMRETFKALAKQMAGKKIDPDTKVIIEDMLIQINTTLVPALIKDSDDAQAQYDAAVAAVDKCRTDRIAEFDGQISDKETATDTARDTHNTCRNHVVTLVQVKDPTTPQTQEYGYDHTGRHWSDYDTNASHAHDYDSAAHPGVVAETDSEQDAYDKMTADCTAVDEKVAAFTLRRQDAACMDSDDVHTWFNFMKSFTDNNAADYKSKREDCHEARHNHQHRVSQCNTDQADFESKYCTWCHAIDTACTNYANCYTSDWAAYNSTAAIVRDLEETFLAQQAALECLLCYGNEIIQERTDLSVCEGATCVGCDALEIEYPVPHVQEPCDPCPHRPCDTEFCDTEYSRYSASGNTPTQGCTACAI